MFHSNRTTRTLRASVTTVLCAGLFATGAMAAPPKLQTIAVTPNGKSISIGQKQYFTATGTFSNGSKHVLGPALSDIAPGGLNTCALLASGGAECWGLNKHGELGDGNYADSLIPLPVKGISTAISVAHSRSDFEEHYGGHGCVLLASGSVKCWGRGGYGELGSGYAGDSTTPVAVLGIGTATAVAAGDAHNCALLASGSVQCWGLGEFGQLGNGSNTNSSIPVPITGIITATALALGEYHSCALLVSGAVQCWGDNYVGQLGDGTTTDANTPVTVSGMGSATAIAAGQDHSCALLASGAVQCWGWNEFGQLGDGSNTNSSVPVTVAGISTAIAITAGEIHTCAVLRSGTVKCWGSNHYGQLGDGTTTSSNTPVGVRAINAPTNVVAGAKHTCALFSGGVMRCWGLNNYGQLGNRRKAGENPNPLSVTVVGTPGVVWTSTDASKATITDRGLAIGRAAGHTAITATTLSLINDNAVLTVK